MHMAQRPAALEDWDEVEGGWWYQVCRDGCEVHFSADPDLGWSIQVLRQGEHVCPDSYHQDLAAAVLLASRRVAQHDVVSEHAGGTT